MGTSNTKTTRLPPAPTGKKVPDEATIAAARRNRRLVHLLLLGAGESGKSTILKQMMLIHGDGFSNDMKENYKQTIPFNLVEGAFTVLQGMKGKDLKVKDEAAAELVTMTYTNVERQDMTLNEDLVNAILNLIQEPDFVATIYDGAHAKLQDGWLEMAKRLENFPEWGGPKWLPNKEDILAGRIRTTGIIEKYFRIDDHVYRMIDVGGQRAERRKYLNYFKGIHGVIFVSSLSEYNQGLFESPQEKRLVESIHLWRSVSGGDAFSSTALLLFLNKCDLFKQKYYEQEIPLTPVVGFREPPTKQDELDDKCELALEWFTELFISQAPASRKDAIYPHVTTAVDTRLMAGVIQSVSHYFVSKIIRSFLGTQD